MNSTDSYSRQINKTTTLETHEPAEMDLVLLGSQDVS